MIGIINYGSGNIDAIINTLKITNIPYKKINILKEFEPSITHLILPGVGGFDETMDLLKSNNWIEWLNELVLVKKFPIMGICVGLQIMFNSSSEGRKEGLGWFSGCVEKLPNDDYFPLPHMGWNSILTKSSNLFSEININDGFYFLHNYYVNPDKKEIIFATSNYIINIPAVIMHDNIIGVQFHPEKSLNNGVQIFRNFYIKS